MAEDPFTKYPWRICGLGFALSEALRYSCGTCVTACCSTMALSYIIHHAFDRGKNAERFMAGAADSLIFDAFASAVIPSFLTFHVCRLTYLAVYDQESGPRTLTSWGPTIAGLIILALTADKVDILVNKLMDKTIRQNSN
ncbi:hypothetical protein BsWGS_21754 [Bradybaena similaris]